MSNISARAQESIVRVHLDDGKSLDDIKTEYPDLAEGIERVKKNPRPVRAGSGPRQSQSVRPAQFS
jgi:hypothetical protein